MHVELVGLSSPLKKKKLAEKEKNSHSLHKL